MKLSELKTFSHKKDLSDESDIFEKIHSECSEILKIYNSCNDMAQLIDDGDHRNRPTLPNVLYRGEKTKTDIFRNEIFTDRKPKYLPNVLHNMANIAFKANQLPANRENAIFCGSIIEAENWGSDVYIIFPVNGFEYVWFQDESVDGYFYNDIMMHTRDFFKALNKQGDLKPLLNSLTDEHTIMLQNELTDLVASHKPKTTNLCSALTAKKEVLVTGKGYYGVRYMWFAKSKPEIAKKLFNV